MYLVYRKKNKLSAWYTKFLMVSFLYVLILISYSYVFLLPLLQIFPFSFSSMLLHVSKPLCFLFLFLRIPFSFFTRKLLLILQSPVQTIISLIKSFLTSSVELPSPLVSSRICGTEPYNECYYMVLNDDGAKIVYF